MLVVWLRGLGPWPMAHGPWPMAHGPWPIPLPRLEARPRAARHVDRDHEPTAGASPCVDTPPLGQTVTPLDSGSRDHKGWLPVDPLRTRGQAYTRDTRSGRPGSGGRGGEPRTAFIPRQAGPFGQDRVLPLSGPLRRQFGERLRQVLGERNSHRETWEVSGSRKRLDWVSVRIAEVGLYLGATPGLGSRVAFEGWTNGLVRGSSLTLPAWASI